MKHHYYTGHIGPEMNDGRHVFVFGSNLAGKHGAGAALEAKRNWGAGHGVGVGPCNRSYAIPTKDLQIKTLPLPEIAVFVGEFLYHACNTPVTTFLVTPIGTGLAGYSHADIAPMFKEAPDNVVLPEEWRVWLDGGGV